jgi:DNA-binding beta-propeller fold protein YncE
VAVLYPYGLAFDGSGNLYVANEGNNVVSKFTSSGGLVNGSFASGLLYPVGVVFDSTGNLYVSNFGKVSEFDSSGTLITSTFASGLNYQTWSLAFDSGTNLYVANYGGNTVSEFNSSGTLIKTLTGLNGPTYIAISAPPPPMLVPMPWTTNGFQLTVSDSTTKTNVVEISTNLVNWSPLFTNMGSFVFTDTNGSHNRQRFYRTKRQ